MRTYATRNELYTEVWDAMSACNSSGVIHAMPAIVDAINEHEGKLGSQINDHALVIILADKLLQLAGVYVSDAKISSAYETVARTMRETSERLSAGISEL